MGLLDILTPAEFAPRVTDIDLDRLWSQGYRALVLDLDNTLVPWMTFDLPDDIRSWMEKAKTAGFKLCILSNTPMRERIRQIEKMFGCPAVGSGYLGIKPRVSPFKRAIARIGADVKKTVMIGDQIFTDILGGNRTGLHTIRIEPIARRDFIATKISRFVERIVLSLIEKRGKWRHHGEQQTADRRPQTEDQDKD
jgi:HAD superfamily phosphatase (TIGR01668 family)